MKLGDLEFHVLTDGTFRLDGGAMFGVIPRPMWERVAPPDNRNRILLAMNSLLICVAGMCILVETGAGDKWDAKKRDIYAFEGTRLPERLAEHGVRPEDVDIVVNTHLHFDHCGWNTRVVNEKVVPTFPNARDVVQAGELEHAQHPTDRDRASYFPDNFEPIAASNPAVCPCRANPKRSASCAHLPCPAGRAACSRRRACNRQASSRQSAHRASAANPPPRAQSSCSACRRALGRASAP